MPIDIEVATTLIIERARQLVNQLIEDRGHDKPPFLPEEFARLLGFKNIVKANLGKTSAVLLRFHDGPVIKVNQNHNLARQNFSCAHEIAHNLLRELKIELDTENISYRTFDPQAPGIAISKARERLCEAAAAELLMPELIFRKYLLDFGVSVNSIEVLANIFRVSIRTTTLRIVEVSPEPCIALLWQLQRKTKSKALRLAWCVGPGERREVSLTIRQFMRRLNILQAYIKHMNMILRLNALRNLSLILMLSMCLWNPKVSGGVKIDM